jgi:hypothetical protein
MTSRVVVFLILAYVSIDFGNPLLPGAVQLVAGSLDTVDADRSRGDDLLEAPAVAAAVLPPMTATSPPEILARLPRAPGVPPRWLLLARRSPAPRADPPSAPEH